MPALACWTTGRLVCPTAKPHVRSTFQSEALSCQRRCRCKTRGAERICSTAVAATPWGDGSPHPSPAAPAALAVDEGEGLRKATAAHVLQLIRGGGLPGNQGLVSSPGRLGVRRGGGAALPICVCSRRSKLQHPCWRRRASCSVLCTHCRSTRSPRAPGSSWRPRCAQAAERPCWRRWRRAGT